MKSSPSCSVSRQKPECRSVFTSVTKELEEIEHVEAPTPLKFVSFRSRMFRRMDRSRKVTKPNVTGTQASLTSRAMFKLGSVERRAPYQKRMRCVHRAVMFLPVDAQCTIVSSSFACARLSPSRPLLFPIGPGYSRLQAGRRAYTRASRYTDVRGRMQRKIADL